MDHKRKLAETSVLQNSESRTAQSGTVLKQEPVQDERKRKKKRKTIVESPPEEEDEEAPVLILRHQNRELSSLSRRLSRKVKKLESRIRDFEQDQDKSIATVSCLKRSWDSLEAGIASVVGESSSASLSNEIIDKLSRGVVPACRPGNDLLVELARPLLTYGTADPTTSWIGNDGIADDNKENKDEEDDEDENGNPTRTKLEVIEKSLQLRVQNTTKVLAELLNKLKAPQNTSEPSTTKIIRDVTAATSKIGLLCDMVRSSQAKLQDTKNRLEDAQLDADKAQRRLARAQSNGLKAVTAEKVGENNGSKSDQGLAPSNESSGGIRKGAADRVAELEDTVKELEELSAKRLLELEDALQQRLKLAKEVSDVHTSAALPVPPHLVYQSSEYVELKNSLNQAAYTKDIALHDLKRVKESEKQLEKKLHFALERIRELETVTDGRWRDYSFQQQSIVSELELKLIALTERLDSQTSSLQQLSSTQQRVVELETLVKAGSSHLEALKLKLARQNESSRVIGLEQQIEELTAKLKGAKETSGSPAEVAKVEASLAKAESALEGARSENKAMQQESDALYAEIESITNAVSSLESQHKRLLEQQAEKDSQNASLMQTQMKVESKMKKMAMEQKVLNDCVETERKVRTDLESNVDQLEKQLQTSDQAKKKLEEQISILTQDLESKDRQLNEQVGQSAKLEALAKSRDEAYAKLKAHQESYLTGKQELSHKNKRLEENIVSLRRKLDRSKARLSKAVSANHGNTEAGSTSNSQSQRNIVDQLKLEAQEEALRCPIYRQYWKDRILIKCMHMFSNKALMDNLSKRNRKCPTCKMNYSKDDIRQIYLYQSNDYGDS